MLQIKNSLAARHIVNSDIWDVEPKNICRTELSKKRLPKTQKQ